MVNMGLRHKHRFDNACSRDQVPGTGLKMGISRASAAKDRAAEDLRMLRSVLQ